MQRGRSASPLQAPRPVPTSPGHKSVQKETAYTSADNHVVGSGPGKGQETLLSPVYWHPATNTSTVTYPEVVTAGRQDCLVSMEFLLLGNQGHIAENAITSLLVQCCEDSVIVRFWVAQPLARQHFLNTTKESKEALFKSFHQLCFPGALSPFQPWGGHLDSSVLRVWPSCSQSCPLLLSVFLFSDFFLFFALFSGLLLLLPSLFLGLNFMCLPESVDLWVCF